MALLRFDDLDSVDNDLIVAGYGARWTGAGPAAVAARLNALAQDDDAYGEYLSWKASGLRPEFRALLDALRDSAFSRLCNALG
jgi:hypothetical protein